MADIHLPIADEFDPAIPPILPHAKVYLIQVGYKLFRLSGASLLSDAPSYFTTYFSQEDNADTVLFIDRNPNIFEKIYNHLQGYHITVESDYEFVHIWLDSYYFGLKRLQRQLNNEDIFASIGGQSFKVAKELFVRTGNYPNFFLINYDSHITDNKRFIMEKSIIRPPPERPATAVSRSPLLFADLIELLRGNTSVIKDDEYRRLLVKEAKYYRFLELEQRILKHKLVFNPFMKLMEILLNLNDLQSRGVANVSTGLNDERPLEYTRPNMLKEPQRVLLLQIESTPESEVKLVLNRSTQLTTLFISNKLAHTYNSVFKRVIMDLQDVTVSNRLVLLAGLANSKMVVNGRELKQDWFVDFFNKKPTEDPETKKRKLDKTEEAEYVEFRLKRSVWRVLTRGDKSRLHAVNIEGYTDHDFYGNSVDFI
ncbi:CIC11C00000004731 [Sungouiella intermedia]|uniref:CIC11C00000004731 n=1 Tax=Sungouiella intermedia TaxID=45354 RepID=A0A1L0DGI1_9ASCO|nr:CIC11C00000004731 [[Candida] intermedia]